MKTLLFNYKFLVLALAVLPLSMCSKDDESEEEAKFEPIEIVFTEDFFTGCDETVSIENIDLTYRKISEDEPSANTIGTCDLQDYSISQEQRENHPFKGLYRLFLSSHLEIDLSKLSGYSKIRLTIEDNCSASCTGANLYVGNNIVDKQFNTVSNPKQEELVFDLKNVDAQKVTVYSYEGILYKINLE